MSLPLPPPRLPPAGLSTFRQRERRMPVPVRHSPSQKRALAAQAQSSLSQRCDSQSSLCSFAAASQLEPSPRDFSPPRPVTLPSSDVTLTVSVAANRVLGAATSTYAAPPVPAYATRDSSLVSSHSAAAAAGLVVRPGGSAAHTTLSVSSRSDSTSPTSAIAGWPSTKLTEQPVAAAVLPSPPPFVSKHKHRQRHSVVDTSQLSQAGDDLAYSSQLEGSTSQYSATVPSRPLVSASQLPSNHFAHSPIHTVTAMHSLQPTNSARAVLSPGLVDALDGGCQYSDPKYFPPAMPYAGMYSPHYSMYYPPPMPSMQPFPNILPPATHPKQSRARPASHVSSDPSASISSDSDDSVSSGNNISRFPPVQSRSMSQRRTKEEKCKQDAAEYKAMYLQHKKLLLSKQQPHSAKALDLMFSKHQLLQIFSVHGHVMRKNTRKALLVATLGEWIEAGRIKKPAQLEVQAERPKKKQCTRTNTAVEAPASHTLRPTVGVKEPRKELSAQQPASAAERTHSSVSSDDNRSSDSDFNPQENKVHAARKRKTKGSSVEDTPSSQSGQAGDNENDSPEQVQRRQPKQAKAVASNAAAASTQQAPLSNSTPSKSSAVASHLADIGTAVPSLSPSDSFHRLPFGYLPACLLTTGGGVVVCVQEYAEFIQAHGGVVERIKPNSHTPHQQLTGGACCAILECTVRGVQPALLRDGSKLEGWHVISLQCAALRGIVQSKLPKSNRRRSKPARKTVASTEGEEQDEVDSDAMQRSSPASTAIPSPTETDKQVHEDVYWKHQLDRPRTRSTNPYSEAIYNSKKKKEERERLNKWADISTSDKRLVALEEQAKKNKRQARRRQDGRVPATQLSAEQSEGKVGVEELAEGGEEVEHAQAKGEEEEDAPMDDGLIAMLYKVSETQDQDAQLASADVAAEAAEERRDSVVVKKEAEAATDSSPPVATAPLLHCRCSFLLADAVYQSYLSREWKMGAWFTMRLRTSNGSLHTRTGRIVDVATRSSTAFRSLHVMWYRKQSITVQTLQPLVGHRRREVSTETKTCAVIDVDQQLALVSPWEIDLMPHPPVRFPHNVDTAHSLLSLPKPDVPISDLLTVQQCDQLLTSLCLEQLYDQLAGYLYLEAIADSELTAEQQRLAVASLSEWHNSVRQLRDRHVAGTLSGFDELAADMQRSTQQLVEAVAYETAVSPLASSCSVLALRIVCVVWNVMKDLSCAVEGGMAVVQQLLAAESMFAGCGDVTRNVGAADAADAGNNDAAGANGGRDV